MKPHLRRSDDSAPGKRRPAAEQLLGLNTTQRGPRNAAERVFRALAYVRATPTAVRNEASAGARSGHCSYG